LWKNSFKEFYSRPKEIDRVGITGADLPDGPGKKVKTLPILPAKLPTLRPCCNHFSGHYKPVWFSRLSPLLLPSFFKLGQIHIGGTNSSVLMVS
jgi:hypothetical protein